MRDAARIGYSQRDLAAHFRLSQSTVCDVLAGRLHADVADVPASALRPARFAAEPVVVLEGAPHRERLFALLQDPCAVLEDVVDAVAAFPGVAAQLGARVREAGRAGVGSVLREAILATSPRGALELVRTTDAYGSASWSAPWVGPPLAEIPRNGPHGVLARLALLEVTL